MYADVLDAVVKMAQEVSPLPVYKGAMPQPDSVGIAIGAGAPTGTTFCKTTQEEISMVINAKSTDMVKARAALDKIHYALTRAEKYPRSDKMEINSILTAGAPSDGGKDGRQFLFFSSIEVNADFY